MGEFLAKAKFGKTKLSLKSLLMGSDLFFTLFLETAALTSIGVSTADWNCLTASSDLSLSVAPCCSSAFHGLLCDNKIINSKEFQFQNVSILLNWTAGRFARRPADVIQRNTHIRQPKDAFATNINSVKFNPSVF